MTINLNAIASQIVDFNAQLTDGGVHWDLANDITRKLANAIIAGDVDLQLPDRGAVCLECGQPAVTKRTSTRYHGAPPANANTTEVYYCRSHTPTRD